jgi:hypothetical protein
MNLSTDGMTYLALHCERNEVTLLENPMAVLSYTCPSRVRRAKSSVCLWDLAEIIMCSKTSRRASRIRPVRS